MLRIVMSATCCTVLAPFLRMATRSMGHAAPPLYHVGCRGDYCRTPQEPNPDSIDPFDPTVDPFERSASAGGAKSPRTPPQIAKIRAQFDIEARLHSAPLRLRLFRS